ncbi:hypothetical protein OLK001_04400 [Synechocystis sp. LKSZ1]
MQSAVLLSEVHPLVDDKYEGILLHPLEQAYSWFDLFSQEEIYILEFLEAQAPIPFSEVISLIYTKVLEKHQTLILRDWNHLDFLGYPFQLPTGQLSTNIALQAHFDLLEIATVRHPIDQWLSMKNWTILSSTNVNDYLKGYWNFLSCCTGKMPIIRYEDFCQTPQQTMQLMCKHLDLVYDQNFINKWMNYHCITGHVDNKNQHLKAKIYPDRSQTLELFQKNKYYQEIIDQLEYDHSPSHRLSTV